MKKSPSSSSSSVTVDENISDETKQPQQQSQQQKDTPYNNWEQSQLLTDSVIENDNEECMVSLDIAPQEPNNGKQLLSGVVGEDEECIVSFDDIPQLQQQQQQQQSEVDMKMLGLADLAPLERQMLRMEGLEPYVLVSVLSCTTSYGTITETAMLKDGAFDLLSSFLLITSTISTVLGIYSTVVFSMSILYGKTALGLDNDDAYYYFMKETSTQRLRGFQAFSYSLLLFVGDIFLIGVDKMQGNSQWIGIIAASVVTIFGYFEFEAILDAAKPMFTGIIPGKEENDNGIGNDNDNDNDNDNNGNNDKKENPKT